jgi:hypothetical protein
MTHLVIPEKWSHKASTYNHYLLDLELQTWLTIRYIEYHQYMLQGNMVLVLDNYHDVRKLKEKFQATELKMIQTINRPKHTYDQFTNNPLKMLAQFFLPLNILRKLWNINARWITVTDPHLDYQTYSNYPSDQHPVLKPHIESWIEEHIQDIKLWPNHDYIELQFRTEELAALFKLSCL